MTEAVDVWGAYKKLTSLPVIGFKRGGRNVESVWGIENMKC